MNNITCLYVVYFGSTSNHSYPMTFKHASTMLANNPDPRWWIGRWEA